jgi:FkbM family methyltransferase
MNINITPENVDYMYFSQSGEDLVVWMYTRKTKGFFVDVGAFHPVHYSNTFALYLRGWRGINIEPNPEPIGIFKELRPQDVTLNCGVSEKAGELDYYSFSIPSGNTFKKEVAEATLLQDKRVREVCPPRKIPTRPLRDILDEHFPKGTAFDLLTVDVEGMDLEVLRSSDWNRYRPELVLVEDHDFLMENYGQSEVFKFMKSQNYTLVSKMMATLMFQETSAFEKRPQFAGKLHGTSLGGEIK